MIIEQQETINEREYVLFPWSVQSKVNPIKIVKGEGIYFWDDKGNRYMDFASQLVNLNIGFNHPKVINAIKEQAEKLCYIAPSFGNDVRSRLAKKIVEITPSNISKCFFTTSGADANENAIKMAKFFTGRHKIIARYRSYHGATFGSISVSGDPRRFAAEPTLNGIVRVLDPYCYRCPFDKEYPQCDIKCAEHVKEVIQFENPNSIAAMIIEPITGSNGIFIPPKEYMKRIRKICDEFGILLIADEVMTGFGRTGEWFGVNLYDIEPDIMTMAKGCNSGYVPLGIVGVSQKIAEYFEDRMLFCGLTYSGHPLACAASMATIEAYEEEGIVENAKKMGNLLAEYLEKIKQKHICVGDVRNAGLFGCIELVRDRKTKEPLCPWNGRSEIMDRIKEELWQEGLYLYLRWNYIFIAPPLIINNQQLKDGMDLIDKKLYLVDKLIS